MTPPYMPPAGMGDEKTLGSVNAWLDDDGYEYSYLRTKSDHHLMMYHPEKTLKENPSLHTGPIAELRLRSAPEFKTKDGEPWDGVVDSIQTHPSELRKGHATRILNFARELSGQYKDFPTPQDSPSRTAAGNALAKAVGLPVLPKSKLLRDEQFTGNI